MSKNYIALTHFKFNRYKNNFFECCPGIILNQSGCWAASGVFAGGFAHEDKLHIRSFMLYAV